MNLVLFAPDELSAPLALSDPRAQHILKVLRRAPGETFDAGVINGPLGKATLLRADDASLHLAFAATREPPTLPPVTLLIGLPRPQTARDLLRDTATLGAACIHFVTTERADPNYASSSLWTSGEWRRHLVAGAAQAFDTRLPAVTWTHTLASALACEAPAQQARLALDNYESNISLAAALAPIPATAQITLALGPERGWGPADRDQLRAAGFTLCSLGQRVLRLETAVVAALSLVHHARP
jgi:RsmE family RNA methyltransferase